MSLLIASGCALLIYWALNSWLLPLIERHTFQSKFAEMTKIGWLAALAFTRRFALIAAATFGGFWLIVNFMGLLCNVFPSMDWMHESFLTALNNLNTYLDFISVGKVFVIFLLLSTILLVVVVRKAKSIAHQEYQSLQKNADNGKLPELEPSEEMLEAAKKLESAQSEYSRLLNISDEEIDDVEKRKKEYFINLFSKAIPEMKRYIRDLDIRRRLLPALAAKTPVPPMADNTWRSRLLTFFTSQGMIHTISRTSGAISTVGLILLMVSFAAANKTIIANFSGDISKRISSVQLQNKRNELNEVWKNSLLKDVPATAKRTWSEEDKRILDGIAREFELAIAHKLGERAGVVPRSVAFRVKANAIRENIIKTYAYRPDGSLLEGFKVAAQGEYLTDLSPDSRAAKEFSQKYATHGLGDSPKTQMGLRFKEYTQKRINDSPSGKAIWDNMIVKYKESFSTSATPRQVTGMMLDQFVTGITDFNSASFTDNIASRAAKKAGVEVMKDLLEYKMDQFITDLAGKASLAEAIDNAASSDFAADKLVQYAVNDFDFPSIEKMDNSLSDYRPALEFDDLGSKRASVKTATRNFVAAASSDNPVSFAESVSDYAHHFPGQAGVQDLSLAAEITDAVVDNFPSPGGGNSTRLARSSAPAVRARSFGALRGFRRIGGVLIGREPNNPQVQVDFRNISWRQQANNRLEILMHRSDGTIISAGSYEKDVVHQALAYIADGRLVTATMISAKPMPYFKILLHPALVNTDLGCRAINVDRFVDKYAREDARVSHALEAYKIQALLYEYAELKMLANSMRSSTPAQFSRALAKYEAEVKKHWSLIYKRLEGGAIFFVPDRSHIAARPSYYSSIVVTRLAKCLMRCKGSYQDFQSHLSQQTISTSSNILKVETEEWSGVREMSYKVDANLSFLRPGTGQNSNLFPLNFMRQIVYIPNSSSDNDEGTEEEVDENPWEFPYLQRTRAIEELVWKGIISNPADRRVFERMRDFTKLQRLFRVAINGQLGYDFPVEKLHNLAQITRSAVKEIETPTWNYNPIADIMKTLQFKSEGEKKAYLELTKALGTSDMKNRYPCN